MNTVNPEKESSLRAQLKKSQKRLNALAGEVGAIDDELEELAVDRQQYELLQEDGFDVSFLDRQQAVESGGSPACAGGLRPGSWHVEP